MNRRSIRWNRHCRLKEEGFIGGGVVGPKAVTATVQWRRQRSYVPRRCESHLYFLALSRHFGTIRKHKNGNETTKILLWHTYALADSFATCNIWMSIEHHKTIYDLHVNISWIYETFAYKYFCDSGLAREFFFVNFLLFLINILGIDSIPTILVYRHSFAFCDLCFSLYFCKGYKLRYMEICTKFYV